MSKISDMAATIEELRSAAAAINDAANWLAEQFSTEAPTEKAPPAPEPLPTLEEVRAILANASRAGHTAEIRSLLQKYGGKKLSEVDPSKYRALLADVGGLNDAT